MKFRDHVENKGQYNIEAIDQGKNSKMVSYSCDQSQHGHEEEISAKQ